MPNLGKNVEKFLHKFEQCIVISLLGMMVLVVFLSTIELAVILVEQLLKSPKFILLNINQLLEIFGFFLMILIGLELLESIKVYLSEEEVHVEIVFLVAMIAIARKVIILDVKSLPPLTLIGIAAIIVALSVGYYMIKKIIREKAKFKESK